ncbi:MAG TPA: RagB/SusD family nutrient uptake outer membrane protein [Longimicrobiales bacterium]|nr:RagB/SusD family nutrient uptake outer membrane protein [Longimicrobiales bacterium]
MEQAIAFLERAESRAFALGLEDVRVAAIVGQARARLWLGDYATARLLATQVPRDFEYWAEYSFNDPQQFNELYMVTWGDVEAIRWTVGDGSSPTRGNERWEHFDAFVALNLLEREPEDFTAFSTSIPVVLQHLYARPDARVLVASGAEAALIRAEADVRDGLTASAEATLNGLRPDYSFRATVRWGVDPPDEGNELQPLTLTGDLQTDLKTVADERARELWLTGDRLTTSRRLRLDPSVDIDLFPPVKSAVGGGDDIAFPIPRLELDTNPNLDAGAACPAPQEIGAWR